MRAQSCVAGAMAFAALAGLVIPAGAQSVESFYKGKQIEVVIGTTTGGGYDTWARLLSRHMGKHLPGNPTLVPRNMPGAGTMVAANYLYNQAPKDGTSLGFVSRNMPTEEILKNPNVKFQTAKFNWIGSPEMTNRICVSMADAKVKKAEDLMKDELIVGGVASTSISTTPTLLNKLLGMKFKLIDGYPGGTEVVLAMERNEVQGICQTLSGIETSRPGWIAQGKLNVLFNMERDPIPALKAPSVHSFAKTEEEHAIISFYNSNAELGRPIMTAPDVPKDRVEALRRAFDATMKDKDFMEDAKKAGLEINTLTGEQVQAVAERIAGTSQAIIDKTIDLVGKIGD